MYCKIFKLIFLGLLALIVTLSMPVLAIQQVRETTVVESVNAQDLLEKGITLYESEQFLGAAAVWLQAASGFANQGDELTQALVLSNLCLAYQHLGEWGEAESAIAKSLSLLENPYNSTNTQLYREIFAKVLNTQGGLQWLKGQLPSALKSWQRATRYYLEADDGAGVVMSSINQAQALQALGYSRDAESLLRQVDEFLAQQSDSQLQSTGFRNLGSAFRRVGKLDESLEALKCSLALAQIPSERGLTLLELGNTERALADKYLAIAKEVQAEQHTLSALEFYQQAATISNFPAQLQPQLNQLSLLIEIGEYSQATALLAPIQKSLPALPRSRTAIFARLNFARSLTCLLPNIDKESLSCSSTNRREQLQKAEVKEVGVNQPSWRDIAEILAIAAQQAQLLQDSQAESYALGQLGGLYELKQQLSDAQEVTEKALLKIEEIKAPDIRYRWEWQLGRILAKQGEIKAAISAYTSAVDSLKSVRHSLLTVNADIQFSFRDHVEPIYRELVDLLLRTDGNSEPSQDNLKRAIEDIDSLQLAELENFLGCNLSLRVPLNQEIEKVDSQALFIYPIILKNRLDVIFKLPGKPLQYSTNPLPQTDVEKRLRELRDGLLETDASEVTEKASIVYQWLIQPLEKYLQENPNIQTLVFVLDGDLRNIPMAVLYDQKNEEYLIEKKYDLALVPSSKLFNLSSKPERLQVLAAGISQPMEVENRQFNALNITQELEQIQTTVESKILLDAEFTEPNIQQYISSGDFAIAHLATHGNFSSDPEETYILIHSTQGSDGELLRARELDNLLRSSNEKVSTPLELLVLSACQTAKGDNRATLGLAGLAIRAGASSTLATLWQVNDQSTVKLMEKFYQELTQPGVTKAQALHHAQQALLKNPKYQAPSSWAPYILVGNWL